jgi:putative acetyltransferase
VGGIIRTETLADVDAISEVTAAAFATLAVSQHTEQYVVRALREAGALAISLVAELDGRVVGHVAFSPVAIGDGACGWYGLGPVSVLPEQQGRGIGRALIERGLGLVRERGGQGCALVGDPGYYARFGFRRVPGLVHEGVPPEVFLALPFTDAVPQGSVVFHEAFRATS